MTIIANPWRPYGLSSDPYFQESLTADPETPHPITLFVGRDAELSLVANQILGGVSTRAVVQGPPGVGKTTFVSRLKTTLACHGVLTHAHPVRVMSEMTANGLAAEILRVLTQIHAASAGRRTWPLTRHAVFWRRVGRQLEGEDTASGGLSAAGVGVSVATGRIAAERRDLALYDEIAQAIDHLTAPPRRGVVRGRVLLHVNNLENLSRADAVRVAGLLQDLRDYFLIPGSHWVFVGTAGLDRAVVGATDAIGAIIPIVATLAPLSQVDVLALLDLRYARLRHGARPVTPPVAADAVRRLYARYDGDLRRFLRLLSTAVQRTVIAGRAGSLDYAAVLHAVTETYQRSLLPIVGARAARHLQGMVKGRPARATYYVADARRQTGLSSAGAHALVARLVAHGVLALSHTEGRSVHYRIAPDVEVGLGVG